jgi:capsular polysaccharide transport system permease protein
VNAHVDAQRLQGEHVLPEREPLPFPRRKPAGDASPPASEREVAVAPAPAWYARLLRRPLFLAVVLVPNVLSLLYFGLIASPVYTSSAALLVLNPKQNGPSLSSLLSGASGDSSEQGGYILKEYFGSWDAFHKLDASLKLSDNFAAGDFVSRFGGLMTALRTNDVALWRYFQKRVAVDIDQKSGIVSLEVSAYDPAFAHRLANVLLGEAVSHMDAMNDQQTGDFVRNAVARKAGIETALRSDLTALAAFRDQTGTYDPKELYSSNLALMNSLAMKATELKAQGQAIGAATPNNPQGANLETATRSVRSDIAATARNFPAMARSSSRYEKLLVSRDNNITLLGQANMAVQEARASAEKNRYYLNVISNPSEPRTAEGPQRLMWIGGIALASLLLWGLLR